MRIVLDDLGKAEVEEIEKLSKEVNEKEYGDHAVFCLMKQIIDTVLFVALVLKLLYNIMRSFLLQQNGFLILRMLFMRSISIR